MGQGRLRPEWAHFVERMYGRKINDPLLYDAIWNTERVPLDQVVDSVVTWVERMQPS